MLIELRDRIREQGKLPPLGEGWGSDVVLRPAGGASFGGDFVVSYSDGKTLEVALVDVSGKGIDAGTRALLLSGALGGLLGSVPRTDFLAAATPTCGAARRRGLRHRRAPLPRPDLGGVRGLLGGPPPGGALRRGDRPVAGHSTPAASSSGWSPICRPSRPPEEGVLRRGDALVLYTDGLVEAPGRDIDAGIDKPPR